MTPFFLVCAEHYSILIKQSKKLWSFSTFITNNVPVFYMAQDLMILMSEPSITRAIGRGGGLKIETFWGPEMATTEACTICTLVHW